MALNLDHLVADCLSAVNDRAPTKVVREILKRAIEKPIDVERALGAAKRGGVDKIYVSDELTIINVIWAPRMTIMPHNHNMWAVIGVYQGREDNIFWRRIPDDAKCRVEAAGAKSLGAGDVRPLGDDIIHSVTNPTRKMTGAIHIYGGDFFATERSEWDPENLEERPYDVDANMRLFEEANRVA